MAKSAEAFRTISEVADDLGIQKHVLRFWEVKFTQIRPMKRGGGRRYYRPEDMELLRGIRKLLHRDGYTIKGVQKILRERGVEAVKQESEIRDGAAGAATRDVEASPIRQSESTSRIASKKAKKATGGARVPSTSDVLQSILAELMACRDALLSDRPLSQGERAPAAKRNRTARRTA